MGGLATVRFSKCTKLALVVQRHGCTVKQGELKDGVQGRHLCKHIVRENIHQRKNHKVEWWHEGGVASSATSMTCCSMWMKETWRNKCANARCWGAAPTIIWNVVKGEEAADHLLWEQTGMQQAATLQRLFTKRWRLDTAVSWKVLLLQPDLRGADSHQPS